MYTFNKYNITAAITHHINCNLMVMFLTHSLKDNPYHLKTDP